MGEDEEEDRGNTEEIIQPTPTMRTPNYNSGRERGSSGGTNTSDSGGSKRSKAPVLGCWSSLQHGLDEHTSAVKEGFQSIIQKQNVEDREIEDCLNLVKQRGVSSHAPEYYMLMKLFKDGYFRCCSWDMKMRLLEGIGSTI